MEGSRLYSGHQIPQCQLFTHHDHVLDKANKQADRLKIKITLSLLPKIRGETNSAAPCFRLSIMTYERGRGKKHINILLAYDTIGM